MSNYALERSVRAMTEHVARTLCGARMTQFHVFLGVLACAVVSGCVAPPALPDVQGGSRFEFATSTLKSRGAFYPDEKAIYVVFRKSDDTRLGGGELTIQRPTSVASLPTDTLLLVRTFKSLALFGATAMCTADAELTLTNDKQYKMRFDFDYNYDDKNKSTCVSTVQTMTLDGQAVEEIPVNAIMSGSRAPIIVPVP